MNRRMSLRPAEEKNCKILWKWRNEKSVREASFDSKYISFEEHKKWFSEKLKSKNTKIFIFYDGPEKEIGEVRFDFKAKKNAEIGVVIDKKERGKGYGAKMLKLACKYVFKNFHIKEIVAYIKSENAVSYKAFRKAGFINAGWEKNKGFVCYKMILKND